MVLSCLCAKRVEISRQEAEEDRKRLREERRRELEALAATPPPPPPSPPPPEQQHQQQPSTGGDASLLPNTALGGEAGSEAGLTPPTAASGQESAAFFDELDLSANEDDAWIIAEARRFATTGQSVQSDPLPPASSTEAGNAGLASPLVADRTRVFVPASLRGVGGGSGGGSDGRPNGDATLFRVGDTPVVSGASTRRVTFANSVEVKAGRCSR